MKEFLQSIFETSNNRIKNPFIGSYIIAFFVYNWRPIIYLFLSDAKIEDKIIVINHEYCSKDSILVPLAISIFYILILPYINLLFDYFLSFSNTQKEEKKNKSILNNLKHKKSEAKIEREIAEERAGTSEILVLKNQIERLILENQNLLEQNKEAFDRYKIATELSEKNERDLKVKIDALEAEKNKIDEKLKKYKIAILPEELTESEKKYFILYGNFKTGITKVIHIDYEAITKFEKYGLIEKITHEKDTPQLSKLGKIFYNYYHKAN